MKKIIHLLSSLLLVFIISFFLSGGTIPINNFNLNNIPFLSSEKTTLDFPKVDLPIKDLPDIPDMDIDIDEEGKKALSFFARIIRFFFIHEATIEQLQKRNYTHIADIAPSLKEAVISVEDSRFYSHYGFDLTAIARAALVNLQYGEIEEGGSTITQQLVKNLFLSHEQTFGRKAEELLLALDIEARFEKDEILEMYLNSVYFGSGYYGITDAAYGYFGKEPSELLLHESAMLAGLLAAPSVYSPYEDFKKAKERQFIVLDAMVKNNYIEKTVAESAKITPIILFH